MLNEPAPWADGLTVPLAVREVLQLMVKEVSVPREGSKGDKPVPTKPFKPFESVSRRMRVPVPLAVLLTEKALDCVTSSPCRCRAGSATMAASKIKLRVRIGRTKVLAAKGDEMQESMWMLGTEIF
jgi:hypothetical protein